MTDSNRAPYFAGFTTHFPGTHGDNTSTVEEAAAACAKRGWALDDGETDADPDGCYLVVLSPEDEATLERDGALEIGIEIADGRTVSVAIYLD